MADDPSTAFCQEIEGFFGGGRCFPLAKGRVALYVGLRALKLPAGSKVLLPGYTCVVVPAAVRHAGLVPMYLDIDPETYNLDPVLLKDVPSHDVAALLVQHTYGIPCDMDAIRKWANAHSISIIEDCCHTFGGRTGGRLCGTFGKFAFMSGQWNKPFSTGLGGMLLTNDDDVTTEVSRIMREEIHSPGFWRNLRLKAQMALYDWCVRPETNALMMHLYRWSSRVGLTIGSSSPGEIAGNIPDDYFTSMARCQVSRGVRELKQIRENMSHRSRLTELYSRRLPDIGFQAPRLDRSLPLVRYPVRVANKGGFLRLAERKRMEIGNWFECPLHPASTPLGKFGYRPGMCPQAERASGEVINLPTHLGISEYTAERLLDFLKRYGTPVVREHR